MTFRTLSVVLAACVLGGALAPAQTPEELKARQCRSVHLNAAALPAGTTALYAEVKPLESADGTYFCASNFNQGYIGMQQIASGQHMLIFSVWDPVSKGDDQHAIPEDERAVLLQKGEGVKTRRFGGEGTGGNSMRPYNWKVGDVVKFLVVQKDDEPGFRQIAGYVYNETAGKWELLSCWRTQADPRGLAYSCSFVEDFLRNYESTKHVRRAAFGPIFARGADGKWVQAKEFRFTGDPTPSDHVRADFDKERRAFTIATGGDLQTDPAWPLFSSKPLPEGTDYPAPGADVEAVVNAPKLERE